MSEKQNPTLFFFRSPHYQLSAIETFLKKRNYVVHIESDIKAGLLKLIEVRPDFVFIAMDHPHPKAALLPDIIEQCVSTNVIGYTHSGRKEDIRKLEESSLMHKIFPPMSGPAVERLTLKLLPQIGEGSANKSHGPNLDGIVNAYIAQLNEKTTLVTAPVQPKAQGVKVKNKNEFYAKAILTTMSSKQKENLQKEFKTRFESEMADILETCASDEISNVVALHEEKKTVYCLLVQSETWSGHLLAHSNVNLESHLLEPVFKNWASLEFKYFTDQESHLFFEIEVDISVFKKWIQNKAEHIEALKVNGSELTMSFVGIEPNQLLVEFNEATDLLEVELDILPVDHDLHLSLFLHLPENKKFLLYTPAGQQLTTNQKNRLTENRVQKLHTPVEFEDELKKLKMRKHLNKNLEDFRNENE